MPNLLDQFIPTTTAFRPSTARELFALRLAQKLADAPAARHYVDLANTYSEGQLMCAYRRTLQAGDPGDPGRRFHVELKQVHGNGYRDHTTKLISIRVERRTVAAAIFYGEHLEYTDARQLSSDRNKAVLSGVGFVAWILNRFAVESAGIECIPNGHEILRRALHEAVCAELRQRMLPIWEVPKPELFQAYGHPPLRSRRELRQVATNVWPVLAGTHAKVLIQDAAVLGLYIQTERVFILN